MLTFVVRRILYSIPVVIIASMLVFVFVHETTDPLARFSQLRDKSAATREGLRIGLYKQPCHEVGDDKVLICTKATLPEQYAHWANDLVHGDLGNSIVSGRAVTTDLSDAFGNTLQLIVWGVAISALVAIGIGVYSAIRQYSILDYTFTGLSFIGLSMPPFWFGLIAIQLFAYTLPQLFGSHTPVFCFIGYHGGCGTGSVDYLRHLALPVMTLTVQIIAEWSRYQRSSMLDVMSSDYIRTARAKGVPRRKVVVKHGLRNALIPLVTVMAIDIGALFGGLIITEQIFSISGMGRLFVNALQNGDTNVLLPWMMVTALFIIAFNLLADVLYGVLDPRIRLS
jgi:peptide/nickel transport system permease protein